MMHGDGETVQQLDGGDSGVLIGGDQEEVALHIAHGQQQDTSTTGWRGM